MEPSELGAAELLRILEGMGVACERLSDSIRLTDSGTIINFEIASDAEAGDAEWINYHAYTHIPRLDRTIFDVAVGHPWQGKSLHETAAEAYVSTVFPLVHVLTTEHVDCMGVSSETLYSTDRETRLPLEWQMLLGPRRNLNLPFDSGTKRQFADAIADLYEPMLVEPSALWFKCYAAKYDHAHWDADCFLNNRLMSEGKRRFLEIARSLEGDERILTCKQHFVIVPSDLDAAMAEMISRRRGSWLSSVERHAPNLDSTLRDQVFLGIETLMANEGCPNGLMERRLAARGCSSDEVWRIPAFVSSACARVQWESSGFRFGDTYVCLNPDSMTGCSESLHDEPIFRCSMRIFAAFRRDGIAEAAFRSVLAHSAENSGLQQIQAQGIPFKDARMKYLTIFTDEEVEGEIDSRVLDELRRLESGEAIESELGTRPARPWWKIW